MTSKFSIRTERSEDFAKVDQLVRSAFTSGKMGYSGEAELVQNLRNAPEYIPALSLVATQDETVVGHIMVTRVYINTESVREPTLMLAPVSVLPEYQGQGIGGLLISKAHDLARSMAEPHIFLLGYASYYPRFGYRPSRDFGIIFPDGLSSDSCMALELQSGSLSAIKGTLEYSQPFLVE